MIKISPDFHPLPIKVREQAKRPASSSITPKHPKSLVPPSHQGREWNSRRRASTAEGPLRIATRTPLKANANRSSSHLEILLEQVHRTPLLSKSEEYRLASQIFLYRQAFQRMALQEPDVVQHLVQLLRGWSNKQIRLDFVCNVALSEKEERKKLEPAIRKAIPRLAKLRQAMESASTSSQTRKLHREVVKLVESLTIRPRSYESSPFKSAKANWLLAEYKQRCERMTRFNLGLVFKVSQKICGRSPLVMDMIQEGTQGLIHAVTKFDHQRNIRFSTYAVPWIRQAIFSSLGNADRLVRIPDSYRAVSKKVNEQLTMLGREMETTAADSGAVISRLSVDLKMKPDRVAKHIQLRRHPSSLDIGTGQAKSATTVGNRIPSKQPLPCASAVENERKQLTASTLHQSLNQREQEVITLRYGLKDGKDRTFAEVGKILGLTRERIRQIEKPALAKLAEIEVMASLHDQLT